MPRFQVNPSHDKPVSEAVLLGHDEIVKALKKFLLSNDMITPLSIAIDGDWGSGKTSIMRTLSRQFNSDQFIKVYFEPWRYENSEPPLALIQTIIKALQKDSMQSIGSGILRLAISALSTKYLGMNVDDASTIIQGNVKAVESFSEELKKVIQEHRSGNQKLLIMIDDLDRCSVENTLLILAIMKLFLDIEDCICIAAVDFERLQQAWRTKYHVSDVKDKGKEYLEKIFQIKVAVPKPNDQQIREYLEELVPNMDDKMLDLFSTIGPKNPRAVKRLLNIISFRASMLNTDFAYDVSTLWSLLEHILTNKNLIRVQKNLQRNEGSIVDLIMNSEEPAIDTYVVTIKNQFDSRQVPNIDDKLKKFLHLAHTYVKKHNLLRDNLNKHFVTMSNLTNEEVE